MVFGSVRAADGGNDKPHIGVLHPEVGRADRARAMHARLGRARHSARTVRHPVGSYHPAVASLCRDEPDVRVAPATWARRYRLALIATDFVAAAIAALVAYVVRFTMINPNIFTDEQLHNYAVATVLLPPVWLIFVALNRAYEPRFVGVGPAEFQRVFRAFLYLTVFVSVVSYATKAEVARGFVLIAFPLALVLTLFGRYRWRRVLHRRRARGQALKSVVVVGGAASVVALETILRRDIYAGMRVVGACLPVEEVEDPASCQLLTDAGIALLGDVDSIRQVAGRAHVDTVAVTSSAALGAEKLRWISWQLEGTPTALVVAPGLIEVAGSRLHVQPVAGLPLLHVEQPQFTGYRRVLKSALDRTIAATALIVLAPLLLSVALAVRFTSRGPALFRQTRVGRNGTTFTIYKFRSMALNAEARRIEIVDKDEGHGLLFKVRADPRVTRLGRIMRKYSVDELPQLINVVTGSMSLVGPRPPLPGEVAQYERDVHRRLLVKPGLTGLWQINGRSDLTWDESVRLDLRYVENWSPALDLTILWKTAHAVLRGSGAY